MNVMYLVTLEHLVDNGIISSQVIDLLCEIKRNNNNVNIVLVAIQPVMIIGRRGISINRYIFCRDNHLKSFLKNNDIKLVLIPFWIPQLRRWGVYLSIWLLTIFSIYCTPFIYALTIIHKTDFIHCRGYLSGFLATIVSVLRRNIKVIFDPRGLLPEEGVEQSLWKYKSVNYNIWKRIEHHILKNCNKVIALSTEFATYLKDIIPSLDVSVIYAGVDIGKYNINPDAKNNFKRIFDLEGKKVFIYVGSLGTWNSPEILAATFKKIHEICGNSYLIVLTNYNKTFILRIFSDYVIDSKNYMIHKATPDDVPKYLSVSDYGIVPGRIHIEDNIALKVTNKTMIGLKVSEYMAAGLPLIVNKDIPALVAILSSNNLGYIFEYDKNTKSVRFENNSVLLDNLHATKAENCKRFSANNFDIDKVAEKYVKLYNSLY